MVNISPMQTEPLLTVNIGTGYTMMVEIAEALHPLGSRPRILYVAVTIGVIVVELLGNKIVLAPEALNVNMPPAHKLPLFTVTVGLTKTVMFAVSGCEAQPCDPKPTTM